MTTWAVLAAAGRGERLGAGQPKSFAALAGRPLLAESLERLEASEWIDAIVVAAPPGWEEPAILLAEELGCGKVTSCVAGGDDRAGSVAAALAEVPDDAVAVLVHDAARPLLPEPVIERVLTALSDGWDGVVPAVPLADTVKRVREVGVVGTLDRRELVAAQTPQAFAAEGVRAAFHSAGGLSATGCAAVVEAQGGRVKVVEGDPRLLKVTTPEDLARVASWL